MNEVHTDLNQIKKDLILFLNKEKIFYGNRELDEQTVPSYTHPIFLVRYVFWLRIFKTIEALELLNDRKIRSVLDFGCGTGIIIPLLQKAFCPEKIWAIDIDENARNITTKMASTFKLNNVDVLENIDNFSEIIKNEKIDAIIALDVLEHVDKLTELTLVLEKTLKKNGVLIVSAPTENFAYRFMRNFGGKAYHGSTHLRNSLETFKILNSRFKLIQEIAIYPIVPFFKLFVFTK